jgi:hypothetical protein
MSNGSVDQTESFMYGASVQLSERKTAVRDLCIILICHNRSRVINHLKWFRIVVCFSDWVLESRESCVSEQRAFQCREYSMHRD